MDTLKGYGLILSRFGTDTQVGDRYSSVTRTNTLQESELIHSIGGDGCSPGIESVNLQG